MNRPCSDKETTMRGSVRLLFGLFGLLLLAGCAAPGMNVSVGYTPFVNATGGTGELYLVQDSVPQINQKALWIIGQVKGYDGLKENDLVVTTLPADLIAGMLADELTSAGYLVKQVNAMPDKASKIVRLSSVAMTLEESLSLFSFKLDATGALALTLELWNNGSRIQSFDYRASFSDSDFKEGELLGSLVLRNSIRDVMKQAVPDIVKSLEKK
jgi:uncharacterized lipoprotein YajG